MSDTYHHADGQRGEAIWALRHSLVLLDQLGLAHQAVLVSQALEMMVADVTPATRAGAE